MGDVGDELLTLALRLLEGLRHVVKGGGQLADLVHLAIVVYPDVKVPRGVLPGGLHHLPDGLNLPHGGDGGGHKRHHQHHKGGHKEEADKALPHGVQRGVGGHGEGHAGGGQPVAGQGGHAQNKPLAGVQPAQVVPLDAEPLLQHGLNHLLRHGDHPALQGFVGGEKHVARRVADEKLHVGDVGGHHCQLAEVLPVIAGVVLQVPGGQPGHHLDPLPELVPLLISGVVVTQGEEGRAQQEQRQQHHADHGQQLPPVQALEVPPEAAHGFSACLAAVTSNL